MRDREENKKGKEEVIYCCRNEHQRTDDKDSKIDSPTSEYKLHYVVIVCMTC